MSGDGVMAAAHKDGAITAARETVRAMLRAHGVTAAEARRVPGVNDFSKPLARFFEHTVLKPETTCSDIDALCATAVKHDCASVCVPPNRVEQAADALRNSEVALCTVIGFPHGYSTSQAKAAEVRELREHGCVEFDMVQPIGLLYDGAYYRLYRDIRAVVEAARPHLTKVILETALLTTEQKVLSSLVAIVAGADYLKTSTGFSSHGATIEDVALLRSLAGDALGVKAAGGVRDYAFARACIDAGADRIGCSRTVEILAAARERNENRGNENGDAASENNAKGGDARGGDA